MSTLRCTRVYSDVNFLPAWYTQQKKLKSSKKRQAVLAVMMVVAMAALTAQSWHKRSALQDHHDSLQVTLSTTQGQVTEVEKLHLEEARLTKELAIRRELYLPISYSTVTGTLASLTPQNISLRRVHVQTEKITTTRKMTPKELKDAKEKSGRRRVKNSVPVTRTVITVKVVGLAPSEDDVVDFIRDLELSNVFQNVVPQFSQPGEWKGRETREFEITMEVPLDRKFIPRTSQEVADAN